MIIDSFQIWDAAEPRDAQKWAEFWKLWPEREIFAHPNYAKLYTDRERRRALCAFCESNQAYVLYPFLFRDLTVEYFWSPDIGPARDIVTPYGYGGPYIWGNGHTQSVADKFWSRFDAWAKEQHVVSEFIRFALFRETILEYPGQQEEKLRNVVRNLDLNEDALWMDFDHKVRKNVRKARRSGVHVELDPLGEKLDDFLRVYKDTMDRREADEGYYFPRTFLQQIHRELGGHFMYFHAIHDGKIISTELVLVSADNVYSFLGGTDKNAFELRPNDLLKYEAILWARNHRKRRFVLGGGYEAGDGIYRYKLGFARNGSIPYFVGRRVFRVGAYDKLVENKKAFARSQGREWIPRDGYFPSYRA